MWPVNPIRWDDRLRRGDSFRLGFRPCHVDDDGVKTYDFNYTGYTGQAQLRRSANSSVVLLEFTVAIADQDLTPGLVWVTATAAQTAPLTEDSGVYDVQLTSPTAEVQTIAYGMLTIDADVTRAAV